MRDLLDQGQAWLADQLTKHASRDVVYQRDGVELHVNATIGRTLFEQTDNTGAIVRFESRDFLIDRNSLVLNGQAFVPQEGDEIIDVIGGMGFAYEVMASTRSPSYRASDPFHHKLRIHTKRVRALV